jgi:hypothetical protein
MRLLVLLASLCAASPLLYLTMRMNDSGDCFSSCFDVTSQTAERREP